MNNKKPDKTKSLKTIDGASEDILAPSPVFDPSLFEDDFTAYDMSEEDRLHMLHILWDMMVSCADMGWGIEPTQAICGQLIKTAFEDTPDSPDVIESKAHTHNLTNCFTSSQNKKET